MAKKTLTPAEIKSASKDIKTAIKNHKAALAPFESDVKAAAAGVIKAQKEADKLIAAAKKAHEGATAKYGKAKAAADKGTAKLEAQLAALQPADGAGATANAA